VSTDLIALIVAIGLGVVIVVVGLRRDLSETTRSNLPRFGEDSESATATVGLWEGERRGRSLLSPRQARWLASFYLLLGLGSATLAVLSSDGRLLRAATAAGFTLAAVRLWQRKWPYSSTVAS
jgi:hypothetical protein